MIFYLSGTGNTKWAAELLAERTGERLVDVFKLSGDSFQYALEEGERLGFCFPVHGWRPPLVFRDFVSKLSITAPGDYYCYALCTAGDTIGETIDILQHDMKSRGIVLDSAFSLLMPESYVCLPFMDVDTPDKERMKKTKAAEELETVAAEVVGRVRGVRRLTVGRWPRINSRLIGGFFARHMITDKPFKVTADKCVGCGRCVSACPIGNVSLSDAGRPTWRRDGSCVNCMACYHHCPSHAIEYGGATRKKGQYYFDMNK